MSGSGGYYKYRCKYWLTYNCPHWVWVNGAPCAHCLADGRDSDVTTMPGSFRISREVYVPQLENGSLHYTIMEIIAASDFDSGWAVKDLPTQAFPTATGPSAVNLTAMERVDAPRNPKSGFQAPADGGSWPGSGVSLE
ncbi:uncharacterized protein LY89DRAFT_727735 [Mollisia scopiformis]|uniref:Uncharacterized protein n=1 Tax=Mollisia scopiformis TaxID=149040 RepID=A0A194XS25_MOLSC|nr:uncharacterized protein LY89DRAFT_727735 [Mollisia scopiformis]KUJ22946.1 hypothetical protein LY89DRAFT_727735 [Mollisia scopiformis]